MRSPVCPRPSSPRSAGAGATITPVAGRHATQSGGAFGYRATPSWPPSAWQPASSSTAWSIWCCSSAYASPTSSIRLTDLTALGLRVEVQKTGAIVTFEWTDELRETVDRARRLRRRVGSLYLFANRRGQQYTTSGFDSIWKSLLRRAGVTGLTFHDLRRWAINEAQRKGGSTTSKPLARTRVGRRRRGIWCRGRSS